MRHGELKPNSQTITRRGLLGLGAGVGVAILTGGCTGNEGQGEQLQRGNIVSPEASPSSPCPETSGVSPTPNASVSPSVSPTAEARLPRIVGEQLKTVWKSIGSATLASAIRGAGEGVRGDPAVEGVTDRRYWGKAIVLGVPRKEVKGETLYLASVTQATDTEGSDTVHYAQVKQGDLFAGHARNDNGDAVETYSGRIRYGSDPSVFAYVTGDLTGERPGWSVEPTLLINPSVSVSNATYTQTPVV